MSRPNHAQGCECILCHPIDLGLPAGSCGPEVDDLAAHEADDLEDALDLAEQERAVRDWLGGG